MPICQAYLARIEEVNYKGPSLRAVIELNPSALQQAKALEQNVKRAESAHHYMGYQFC